MSTRVTPDQFEISDQGITHKPTGCTFTPHPGQPLSGNMAARAARQQAPLRRGYRPHEVKAMMNELWTEHCARKNGVTPSP